jgi:hypothetical protein
MAHVLSPSPVYLFGDENKEGKIILTNESVALSEPSYKGWESFTKRFDLVRSTLEDVFSPVFYTRVGLRYVDVVDPLELGIDQPDSWAQYFRSEVLGLAAVGDLLGTGVKAAKTETQISLDLSVASSVAIRTAIVRPTNTKEEKRDAFKFDADFSAEGKVLRDQSPTNSLRCLNPNSWLQAENLKAELRLSVQFDKIETNAESSLEVTDHTSVQRWIALAILFALPPAGVAEVSAYLQDIREFYSFQSTPPLVANLAPTLTVGEVVQSGTTRDVYLGDD